MEAQDITTYLKPLASHIEGFEEVDFNELLPKLAPLIHVVCLIWSNSQYYNTAPRIIVLLQEICNSLIDQVNTWYYDS